MGLSGVGKTQLGKCVSEDLGFLHIEQDRPEGDVIDMLRVRKEWDDFLSGKDAAPLAQELRKIVKAVGKKGLIMTFTSMVGLRAAHIKTAEKAGIATVLLYGAGEDCLNSYLKREKKSGRGYDEARWILYNMDSLRLFSRPEYEQYRLPAFKNHKRVSRESLVKLLVQRLKTI